MKVGLVDDQVLFLHGIAQIISSQPDMDVIWQANDGEDALTQCAATPADVVLMDVQMPVRDGISATAEIASTLPETKVIILTTFDDEDYEEPDVYDIFGEDDGDEDADYFDNDDADVDDESEGEAAEEK